MSAVTLTDQLGAMNIIDALRQQHLRIEDHLDLPRRRAEIATRIREYYATQNIAVDDAMIDSGVRQYFADRLTWEPPQFSGEAIKSRFAAAVITRDEWGPTALRVTAIVGVIAAVAVGTVAGVRHYQDQQAREDLAAANITFSASKARLSLLGDELAILRSAPVTYARTPVAGAVAMAESTLGDCQKLAAVGSAEIAKIEDVPAKTTKVSTENTAVAGCADILERGLNAGRTLAQADQRLTGMEQGDLYVQHKGARAVQKAFMEARTALGVGASSSVATVEAAQAALRQMAGVQAKTADLTLMTAKFKELPMPDADRKTVDSLIADATAAAEQGDAAEVTATLKKLDVLYRMASTDLALNVVSRSGMQSGVRRTFSKSGGNAWYLIVEATTPAGEVIPLPVKNYETGATAVVKTYGVRVSEEEFNRVRAEKMKDGHVRNRLLGTKPRGHLSFSFARPVMAETITAW